MAEPTDPITRYLRPDSSEVARRSSLAHSTYSGMDSSSSPTKKTIRFSAPTSTTMPAIDESSSEWNSPAPASRTAVERIDSRTANSPAT